MSDEEMIEKFSKMTDTQKLVALMLLTIPKGSIPDGRIDIVIGRVTGQNPNHGPAGESK